MLAVRRADERGRSETDWLDSRHTFSFADYDDPRYRGFRALRVINEDRVLGGSGFGAHPHRDMEIISYVLEGALEHKDSMGTGSVIGPGDVQRMSAGTGVVHSEWNHSKSEPVHFLQIWIIPDKRGIAPGYEQRRLPPADTAGRLRILASRDGREGSVTIHQDVSIYATILGPGERVEHRLGQERCAWIQVAAGTVELDGRPMAEGDGAAIVSQVALSLTGTGQGAEVLLFDLA